MKNYWQESVSSALDECEICATKTQIESIANAMKLSHECIGLTSYSPRQEVSSRNCEIAELKKALGVEKSMRFCRTCLGNGYIITNGIGFSSASDCLVCNGKGKYK